MGKYRFSSCRDFRRSYSCGCGMTYDVVLLFRDGLSGQDFIRHPRLKSFTDKRNSPKLQANRNDNP